MSQKTLQPIGGALTNESLSNLDSNISELFSKVFGTGNVFYVDAVNGSDSTGDGTATKPFASLLNGYNACVTGHNDVVALVGDGGTTGTQRQTAAFTWAKNATHLVGIASPTLYSQRARIAPASGATAYTPMMTISGSGCIFANIQWFHGFTTGTTSQITLNITGSRNVFRNCHIAGMGDAESGNSAGSRCIKFTAGSENVFEDCVIGLDTVVRSAANASIEFATGSTRNVFRRCHFPFFTDDATVLGYVGSAAACLDRHNTFEDCSFINAIKSTSTAMDALGTLAASAGGMLLFRGCSLVGITEFGTDATTRAQCYVDGAAPTAATSGVAVNPT